MSKPRTVRYHDQPPAQNKHQHDTPQYRAKWKNRRVLVAGIKGGGYCVTMKRLNSRGQVSMLNFSCSEEAAGALVAGIIKVQEKRKELSSAQDRS